VPPRPIESAPLVLNTILYVKVRNIFFSGNWLSCCFCDSQISMKAVVIMALAVYEVLFVLPLCVKLHLRDGRTDCPSVRLLDAV